MIGAFIFNGVESSTFKLVCRSVKRPLLPAAKVKRIELAGASGAYDFDENEYSLRQITMRITYIGDDYHELRSRAREIAAWLGTSHWARLTIHDEPDKYYLAKVTSELDLQSVWEAGTVDIIFDCQPFALSLAEENVSFSGSGVHTFINPGTRAIDCRSPYGSLSMVSITGSWLSFSLTMNGSTLLYTQAENGTLTIDSIKMEAVMGSVNKFGALDGDIDTFFTIKPGSNTVNFTGNGLSANVSIRYIPLWL